MKKEVIIAIIIGFSLGLVITFGIHTARQSNRPDSRDSFTTPLPTQEDGSNPSNQSAAGHRVELVSPQPNSVIDETPIHVVGTTSPNSLVAILNGTFSTSTAADTNGNFSASVDLTAGINTLNLISYSPSFEQASASGILVYTPLDLDTTPGTGSARNN